MRNRMMKIRESAVIVKRKIMRFDNPSNRRSNRKPKIKENRLPARCKATAMAAIILAADLFWGFTTNQRHHAARRDAETFRRVDFFTGREILRRRGGIGREPIPGRLPR